MKLLSIILLLTHLSSCAQEAVSTLTTHHEIIPGAHRLSLYMPLLDSKKVGLVVNHTSTIAGTHLVDTLLSQDVEIIRIFSPEHGFRGDADAGAKVNDGKDQKTGIRIVSLYGSNRKPTQDQLADIDIILFDVQDVGVRFYTYISTLALVMEAAAERGIPVIILDRPNPNGHYVDGPVLQRGYESFVGMHPVPIVYGMTIGEYGKMVNGEGWMASGLACALTVIPIEHYHRNMRYNLPIRPSPNLPNIRSVTLYPSLCLLEGTVVSVGRGTDMQFQVYGHPDMSQAQFTFTPLPGPGSSNPKLKGQLCYGYDLSTVNVDSIRQEGRLDLTPLIESYQKVSGTDFFLPNLFFDKLAGSDQLRLQILSDTPVRLIRESWKNDLDTFKAIRAKYLIYP